MGARVGQGREKRNGNLETVYVWKKPKIQSVPCNR